MSFKNNIGGNHRQCWFNNTHGCPCREVKLGEEISFCRFFEFYAEILVLNNERATSSFLSKVCDNIKNEVKHHDYRAIQLQRRAKKFLDHVKVGDRVYSIRQNQDVVFLEHPTHRYGDCKYKNPDGIIKKDAPFLFSIISKGEEFGIYITKDRKKAYLYTLEGRECGFRVERHDAGDDYILKIYSDTQKEVDSFITILNNELILDDY